MCVVEDKGGPECATHGMRAQYYTIGVPRLMELMGEACFVRVERRDGAFFQPVIVGTREG